MCLPYEGANPGRLPALMQTEPGSKAYSVRERQLMAKSRSRQNSKKKRDKRRLLKRQAAAVSSWQTLDVAGWFDIAHYPETDFYVDRFFTGSDDLPDVVFEDVLPAEVLFNYYEHAHPDQEEELLSVTCIRELYRLEKNADFEVYGEPRPKKDILKDLNKLAKAGSVIASSFLGTSYALGMFVRKNLDKAEPYLRFAAEKNEPLACFRLALLLDGEEADQYLDKSCALACPEALFFRLDQILSGSRQATGAELDMLAGNLAALASNGSMKCLKTLLGFLGTGYGEPLWAEYGPAMIRLLDGLADDDYVPAIEYKAELLSLGRLGPVRMEEAKRLYLKAQVLGSRSAAVRHATCLLQETNNDDMTRQAKEEHVQAARKILEAEHTKGNILPVTDSLLGCILVMSDDDDDFRRGIQLLETSLAENFPDMPLRAANQILLWSDKPERHKLAIKILNILVRKKHPLAIYLRGRCYLEGGLAGRRDMGKGLDLLRKASGMGVEQAFFLLIEILVFGLYKLEIERETAMDLAEKGIRKSRRCAILYSLMQLGELPGYTASHLDDHATNELFGRIINNAETDDNYLSVAIALIHLGADTLLKDYILDCGLSLPGCSEQQLRSIVEEIASDCDNNMQSCNLGPVCYTAHALRRIGKTSNAGLTAAIFARKLHLDQGASCNDIADYLQEFVRSVPESYVHYRLAYSTNDTDENRPLY